MSSVTYQDIMMEAEIMASSHQSEKDEDELDAPLIYPELAKMYDVILLMSKQLIERLRNKREHGNE